MSSRIPIDLRELLAKLKFLSMIQSGNKVNTNTMSFVDSDSWYGAVRRALNHENRKVTLDFVNTTIDQTIEYVNKHEKSEFLELIINRLNAARVGISELLVTYREDPKFISNITVSLDNIDIQLSKYKHLIRGNERILMDSACGDQYV